MNIQNTSIFVVEDDKFFASMIKETLGQNRFKNITVFNSGEDCISNLYQSPEVVILDYSLGSMNGLEVLKEIKSINPNIQVIFLSAQEKMNVAIDSLKFGAYDYLDKTDQGLQKLSHLVKRIILTNKMILENQHYDKLRKWFNVTAFALAFILLYQFLR